MWGLTQIKKKGLRDFGAALAPEAAHHIAIGAETLALRLERQCRNTQVLAETLERDPRVAKVFYPGLETHPQHALGERCFAIPVRCSASN